MGVERVEVLHVGELVHELSVEIALVGLSLHFDFDFVPLVRGEVHRLGVSDYAPSAESSLLHAALGVAPAAHVPPVEAVALDSEADEESFRSACLLRLQLKRVVLHSFDVGLVVQCHEGRSRHRFLLELAARCRPFAALRRHAERARVLGSA